MVSGLPAARSMWDQFFSFSWLISNKSLAHLQIMEARGNSPSYGAQGTNFVRSSLNYGPMDTLLHTIYGWYSSKRTPFSSDFHTYSLEWTGDFMRLYTDSRLHAMLDLRLTKSKESFWSRGGFPTTTQNGSTEVVVQNPYSGKGYAAPFDQCEMHSVYRGQYWVLTKPICPASVLFGTGPGCWWHEWLVPRLCR